MLRRLHDQLNAIITWFKRNRRIATDREIVKVNLGSGLTVADGWLNVDGHLRTFFSKWPRFILSMVYSSVQSSNKVHTRDEYIQILKTNDYIHHNLRYGIPFHDASVDYLYASHLLEHLFFADAVGFLNEAYRVLKPGGIFRIGVPDLSYVFGLYDQGKRKKALAYFFETSPADALACHRYMYDFELLRDVLEETGFKKISHCAYREGETPDIAMLDRLPDETLFVEATK